MAGLNAIVMLLPACVGSVSAEPAVSAEAASVSVELPELEEPMPEEAVAAQIDADLDAIAPELSLTKIDMSKTAPVVGAGEQVTEDGLHYTVLARTIHITGCDEGITDVVIPDTIDDYPVTYIDAEAFYGRQDITSITFPDSLVGIAASAFVGCTGLTDLVIPEGVKMINTNAFTMCSNLKNISLPSTLTIIGSEVFAYCTALESITIPGGVTALGTTMFTNCSGLKTVILEEGVQTIGANAFYNCSSLENVQFPESSMKSILAGAFSYSGVTSLDLPDSITSIQPAHSAIVKI